MDYTNRNLLVNHIPEFNLIHLFIKAVKKPFHSTEIRECFYRDNTEPEFNGPKDPQMDPCTDQSEISTTVKKTDTSYPYVFTDNTFITA